MAGLGATYSPQEACRILKEARFTDFKIKCDQATFHVHRSVIYEKSEYFKALLDNDFREKNEGVLELTETSPTAVAYVILFCYTNDLLVNLQDGEEFLTQAWPAEFDTILVEEDLSKRLNTMLDVYLLADRMLLASLTAKLVDEFWHALYYCAGNSKPTVGDNIEGRLMAFLRRMYDEVAEHCVLRVSVTSWIMCATADGQLPSLRSLAMEADVSSATAAMLAIKGCRDVRQGFVGNLDFVWSYQGKHMKKLPR